jgi:hypothetical protein
MAPLTVQACLNGARARGDHPALPLSAAELAADAAAVRRAGASSVHVHPRDADGRRTLKRGPCDAAVGAIRAAVPRYPISVSATAGIEPDPFARADLVKRWRQPPDLVSITLAELGWAGVLRAALHAGISVEAGVASPAEAEELAASPFGHQLARAVVVAQNLEDAEAIARLIPDGVTQLWHGAGPETWTVVGARGAPRPRRRRRPRGPHRAAGRAGAPGRQSRRRERRARHRGARARLSTRSHAAAVAAATISASGTSRGERKAQARFSPATTAAAGSDDLGRAPPDGRDEHAADDDDERAAGSGQRAPDAHRGVAVTALREVTVSSESAAGDIIAPPNPWTARAVIIIAGDVESPAELERFHVLLNKGLGLGG